MYKYICGTCHVVTDEDVWFCVNCSDESCIHQVQIIESDSNEYIRMVFHRGIEFSEGKILASFLIPDNCNYSHSMHTGECYSQLTFVYRKM